MLTLGKLFLIFKKLINVPLFCSDLLKLNYLDNFYILDLLFEVFLFKPVF